MKLHIAIRRTAKTIRRKAEARKRQMMRGLEYRRLKRYRKKTVPGYSHCKNCGTELKGMYCHVCGQYALDTEQPFWKYVLQYFENVYQFDGKVWVTLWNLFRRPGYLTTEFNAGKIASYVHPMRLLMFISVVFFLFFFTFINGKIDSAIGNGRESMKDSHAISEMSSRGIVLDSLGKGNAVEAMEAASSIIAGELGDAPLAETENPKQNPRTDRISLFKEHIMGTMSGYASLMTLLLIPLLALMLKGFYRKCHIPYMGHFVFSLHFASFFFILVSLWIFAGEKFGYGGIVLYAFLVLIIIYATMASHWVYRGTGWIKAAVKSILVLSLYFFIIVVILFAATVYLVYREKDMLEGIVN